MPPKKQYTAEQEIILHEAALRVYNKHFKGQPKAQIKYGLAIGVSQQTVSKLIVGDYTPSPKIATEIAVLDGKESLEELIGEFPVVEAAPAAATGAVQSEPFENLSTCINFHKSSKHWSSWTIAAARAGFFGNADFAAPEWTKKLDYLEKALERLRKV
jgi:DNA-binding XRE family transcriptional regulator